MNAARSEPVAPMMTNHAVRPMPPAASRQREGLMILGIGRVMVYVLFLRLLQHARSLHLLVLAGYPEEAELIARAMAANAVSLVAIVHDQSDGRALQFVKHGAPLRRKKLDGYIRQDII